MAPNAVDLSHHLSPQARRRKPIMVSAPPGLSKNAINLDGGVPAPNYFPFETLSSQYLVPDAFPLDPSAPTGEEGILAWISGLFTSKKKQDATKPVANTSDFKINRYKNPSVDYAIQTMMTYSPTTGLAPFAQFVQEFVGLTYRPAYADWGTLIDIGNSNALTKILDVVTVPGQGILVDEWTYNPALAQMREAGLIPAAVKIDAVGLVAEDLEEVLTKWDESVRGFPRPKVLYQVPVGQNPTGTTLTAERKQEIYAVAVKWDLVIIEDDPYYFQQAGPYVHTSIRTAEHNSTGTDEEWRESLVPSFLRYDYQGRVVRIDTFSKTLGPGGRAGFFTTSPVILKYLTLTQAGTTGAPSGLTQGLFGTLLQRFGQDGYVRWLRGLKGQYQMRRNWVIDALFESDDIDFQEETNDLGQRILVAYPASSKSKSKSLFGGWSEKETVDEKAAARKPLFELVPASAGMFLWFKFHLQNHPSFARLASEQSFADARIYLADKVWKDLAKGNVVLRPGHAFQARSEEERDAVRDAAAYLRLSYASAPKEDLEKAVEYFTAAVVKFFNEEA